MLKISAFYLEKQKSFVPRNICGCVSNQHKKGKFLIFWIVKRASAHDYTVNDNWLVNTPNSNMSSQDFIRRTLTSIFLDWLWEKKKNKKVFSPNRSNFNTSCIIATIKSVQSLHNGLKKMHLKCAIKGYLL